MFIHTIYMGQLLNEKKLKTMRQVSSIIHSARPIVTPVANIVFCCFVFLDLKGGDGRTTCAKTMISTGRDFWVGRVDQYGEIIWKSCHEAIFIHYPKLYSMMFVILNELFVKQLK